MKEKLIILGAGGHCRVVLDILLENAQYDIVGLISQETKSIMGIPVIGQDKDLQGLYQQSICKVFVAIGNNKLREKLSQNLAGLGFSLINAISSHAIISRFSSMGVGNALMPGAVINSGTNLGNGCIVNTNASVDHDCKIGDYVHIAPGCALSGSVTIGNYSFLGTGTNVIDGIAIGEHVMIGGGASVVKDIPSSCTAVGVPARIIKTHGLES